MKIKIVADSSANLLELEGVDFQSAPLVIRTSEKQFVDDSTLDVEAMADYLIAYKGKSGTACPGVGDYLEAFEGYDEIYVVTIFSVLSGSYNSALLAKKQYEEENPGKKVCVLDSRGTGPEMKLHIDMIKKMILEGKDFETIEKEIDAYRGTKTSILFCLESLSNLANNGRVNMAVAKIANILGIRVIGDADDKGINPTDKVRGEKKAISTSFNNMKKKGYKG
ncbi:MAG: DegV family protein, partial [Dorea sp.]